MGARVVLLQVRRAVALGLAASLLAGGLALSAGTAAAAGGQVTVSADVLQDLALTLSTGTVSFGSVVPSGSPYTVGSAVTVTVQANVPYHLQHSATSLVRSGGTEALPPLQYADAGSGAFAEFPGAAATVKSGGPTAGTSYAFDYRVTVPWTGAPPGNYTGGVTYQVMAQ